MRLIIRVACRLCGRQFVIPSMNYATRPRPCCDDCMDRDEVTERTDYEDFRW